MTKINLAELSELVLYEQVVMNETVPTHDEQEIKEPVTLSGNEIAKREMAAELLQQGLSEEAVCRILNISHSLLPEPLPF